MSTGTNAKLTDRVRRGDYVVDVDAVAEAMMRRLHADPLSVLVTAEPSDGPAVDVDQDKPAPGPDVA
jgi:hypothetical protein